MNLGLGFLFGCFAVFCPGLVGAQEITKPQLDYTLHTKETPKALSELGYHYKKVAPQDEVVEERYNYSIGVGGWSRHDTGGKPNRFKEQNPMVEFDILLDYELLGGRPLVGYNHVFKNSRRGKTDIVFVANQWKLVPGEYVDLCGGLGVMRARYTDPTAKPGKKNSLTENLPLLYLCLEKGPVSLRVTPLGKNVYFMYFIYSFK